MKIVFASSFWIFSLAVILNSIELSLQSGTARGPGFFTPRGIRSGSLPFRKVRCPTDEQIAFETTFMLEDAEGSHVNCTPDKILLAIGPLIIGHILNNVILPISGTFGSEVTYNEFTNKLIRVSRCYLRDNFGVFGPVPEETLRSRIIHPFGKYNSKKPRSSTRPTSPTRPSSSARASSPTRPSSSTRPSSPTRPRNPTRSNSPERPSSPTIISSPETPRTPPMMISDSDSIPGSNFDTDSVSSSSSSSSARSSFSRTISNASSRSGRPPSSTSGSPGKK